VLKLEYHAYHALAVKEGRRIVAEAMDRFDVIGIQAVHREGTLGIGDVAVWIGVLAAHRAEAFEACQYMINRIKSRLPIWKKEFYADSGVDWVGCTHRAKPEVNEQEYYSKQLLLPQVGVAGQERLKNARVAVVGAGGLGCPAITSLAAAGVGQLGVFDHDRVESSNLHRQALYTVEDIGQFKADAAKRRLESLNPFIDIEAFCHRVSYPESLNQLEEYDIILDGSDNLETKYMLNQMCQQTGTVLVTAAVHHWQAVLHTFFADGSSGCFACLSEVAASDECVTGCTESGILGVVTSIVGALQANEAIALLLGLRPRSADNGLLIDLRTLSVSRYRRSVRDGCPVCGNGSAVERPTSSGEPRERFDFEVDGDKIAVSPEPFVLVDLTSEGVGSVDDGLTGDRHRLTAPEIQQLQKLPRGREYLLVCEHGRTSRRLANRLRGMGLNNFYSLIGGADSLSQSGS
jgi:adenylyltransferase/sulfurtransferase